MDRKPLAWTLICLLSVFPVVLWASDPLTDLEKVAGKLVFYQMEGNVLNVRDTGELASDVPTEATFELLDPLENLSSAEFSYTWDLGNGEVMHGREPVVHYRYSESGNYTVRLKVGVNVSKSAPPITGVFSTDVHVLDAVKNIELKGPSDYKVSQDTSLAFRVDGSPPMWVCWRFLTNCEPGMVGCTLAMLYENTLQLNHTFTSTGVHCLDISVRNDISKLQTSFSLYVSRNSPPNFPNVQDQLGCQHRQISDAGYSHEPLCCKKGINRLCDSFTLRVCCDPPHLFFILSCAAILAVTVSFIIAVACRPYHKNQSQVVASSNAIFLKDRDSENQNQIHLNISTMAVEEKEPLMFRQGTQYLS